MFDDVIERLREHFDVNAASEVTQYAPEQITAALRDVDGALITLNEGIGATQLKSAARLRAIANVGVGYNNLDIPALQAVSIVATNTPDVLTETTADFGFALMMATARRRLRHARDLPQPESLDGRDRARDACVVCRFR